MFEELTLFEGKKCGLFVSVEYHFLSATPDGLVKNEAMVEVKGSHGGRDVDILFGTKFPIIVESNGKITLKSSHKYHDQIQDYCIFQIQNSATSLYTHFVTF